MIFAITIDRINYLSETLAAIDKLPSSIPGWPPVFRLVIDPQVPASDYLDACTALVAARGKVMLSIDSYAQLPTEDWKGYDIDSYRARFEEICSVLGQYAGYVEILNEGGVWDLQHDDLIIGMARAAFEVVQNYNNQTQEKDRLIPMACYYLDPDEPDRMAAFAIKARLVVLLNTISFYPRSGSKPFAISEALDMLTAAFAELASIVTGELGIGETGSEDGDGNTGNVMDQAALVKAMYGYRPPEGATWASRFVGFVAWWDWVRQAARDSLLSVFEGLGK